MKTQKMLFSMVAIVTITLLLVLLTGCTNNTTDNSKDIDDIINSTPESSKNTKSKETESYSGIDDLELYSDDTKIVFNMQNVYYIVYYHNGNELTGLEYIYDYEDAKTAKMMETAIKANYDDDDSIEKVEVEGSKLRVIFKKSAYENDTLESIKETYSFLNEVKK